VLPFYFEKEVILKVKIEIKRRDKIQNKKKSMYDILRKT